MFATLCRQTVAHYRNTSVHVFLFLENLSRLSFPAVPSAQYRECVFVAVCVCVCVCVFFVYSSIAVSKLEPDLRESIASKYGDKIQCVYFNKGL